MLAFVDLDSFENNSEEVGDNILEFGTMEMIATAI